MLNSVCHFEIPADDVDKLQQFYSGLFGWTFTKMPGPVDYYIIETGAELPKGGMMARQVPEQCPVNYIMVESLDSSLGKAQELGATVVVPKTAVPTMGWFAVLIDPQKNPIGLWQTDPNAVCASAAKE